MALVLIHRDAEFEYAATVNPVFGARMLGSVCSETPVSSEAAFRESDPC